jgi:hypothetical protein
MALVRQVQRVPWQSLVCTHTAATHHDSYTPKNKRERNNSNININKHEAQQAPKKSHTTVNTQAAAYLVLSDLLPENYTPTQSHEDEVLDW